MFLNDISMKGKKRNQHKVASKIMDLSIQNAQIAYPIL
jgi:hypothetical protein